MKYKYKKLPKYKKGGNKNQPPESELKPIVVTDPNDPRYQAYQDSLILYDFFKNDINKLKNSKDWDEWNDYVKNIDYNNTDPSYNRLTKLNNQRPIPSNTYSKTFNNDKSGYAEDFAKPNQPVILKERVKQEQIKNVPVVDPLNTQSNNQNLEKLNIDTTIKSTNHRKQSKNYPGYDEVIGPDVNGITKIIGYQNRTTNKYTPKMRYGGKLPKYKKGGDQNKKPDPIVVTNPNDPRLKAYNDSLDLYNKGLIPFLGEGYSKSTYKPSEDYGKTNIKKEDVLEQIDIIKSEIKAYKEEGLDLTNLQQRLDLLNTSLKTGIYPTNMLFPEREDSALIYKKPNQPVILNMVGYPNTNKGVYNREISALPRPKQEPIKNVSVVDPLTTSTDNQNLSKIDMDTKMKNPNHRVHSKDYPAYDDVIGPDINGIIKKIGMQHRETNKYYPKMRYGGQLPKYGKGGKKFLAGLAGFGTGLISAIPGIGQPIANAINNTDVAEEQAFQIASPIGSELGQVGMQVGMAAATGGLANTNQLSGGLGQRAVAGFKYGGKLTAMRNMYKRGGMINYSGATHENGGIPINDNMKPVSRNKATAEVEDGEVAWNNYIFSNYLKPKRKF